MQLGTRGMATRSRCAHAGQRFRGGHSVWGSSRLCQCPPASYHPPSFSDSRDTSLELRAEMPGWAGGTEGAGSAVSSAEARLMFPRGRRHLPGTLTSAHYTRWLQGGAKPPLCLGKGLGQLWAEGLFVCLFVALQVNSRCEAGQGSS